MGVLQSMAGTCGSCMVLTLSGVEVQACGDRRGAQLQSCVLWNNLSACGVGQPCVAWSASTTHVGGSPISPRVCLLPLPDEFILPWADEGRGRRHY